MRIYLATLNCKKSLRVSVGGGSAVLAFAEGKGRLCRHGGKGGIPPYI